MFIVGAPRSGTSLLYRILQRHSAFRPKRLNLEETAIFSYLWRLPFVRRHEPASLFNYMLRDEKAYQSFVKAITPFRALSACLLIPNALLRDSATWWWRHVNRSDVVLRIYFYFAKQARGCEQLVEKTPENWRYIERIVGAFPHCKMVYIARHPVEQFASYRRRARDDPSARWAAVSVTRFCSDYDLSTRIALSARESLPESFFLIRYEQLTSQPRQLLEELCDFLSVPIEYEALDEANPEKIEWVADPHLFGEISTHTKDWQDYVSPDEVSEIERRLGPVMRHLGYSALCS